MGLFNGSTVTNLLIALMKIERHNAIKKTALINAPRTPARTQPYVFPVLETSVSLRCENRNAKYPTANEIISDNI